MKIRPVDAELFHADGQTDVTKQIVAFLIFSNVPKKLKRVTVQFVTQRAMKAQKGSRSVAVLLLQPRHAPVASPTGKAHYPLHRRQFGPQGISGQIQKTSPPPDFETRPV